MQKESRVQKSMQNAKVNLIFYFLSLLIAFFSRKIFLDYLGADFIGLTGTIGNLLGFLNLADLGIGASISFVLYKPIFDGDKEKICEIISVLGYLYRMVGLAILFMGIVMSIFIPWIFPNTPFDPLLIYYTFFAFLAANLYGYFINYRYTLLGADQKNYVVTEYSQLANLAKTLIQMGLIYYTRNLYLWVTIELVFGILYCFILNWRIRKEYPWLKTSIALGREKRREYGIILKKSKQLFVHLLASNVRDQVLPFLIYAYTTLKMVAYYGNYMLIVAKLSVLLDKIMGSTGAGVGNLIAEGNKKNIVKVFWELYAIRFYVACVIVFALFYLISPFIKIWLGEQYLLETSVVIIILLNLFLKLTRGVVDQFIYGYGLYQDTWAPIVTLCLTFGVAIVAGKYWGLFGVLCGDAASVLAIIFIWKPIFLYWKGFQLPKRLYWIELCKYFIAFAIAWTVSAFVMGFIIIDAYANYFSWTLYAVILTSVFALVIFASMYVMCQGMRDFSVRVGTGVKNKFKKK